MDKFPGLSIQIFQKSKENWFMAACLTQSASNFYGNQRKCICLVAAGNGWDNFAERVDLSKGEGGGDRFCLYLKMRVGKYWGEGGLLSQKKKNLQEGVGKETFPFFFLHASLPYCLPCLRLNAEWEGASVHLLCVLVGVSLFRATQNGSYHSHNTDKEKS